MDEKRRPGRPYAPPEDEKYQERRTLYRHKASAKANPENLEMQARMHRAADFLQAAPKREGQEIKNMHKRDLMRVVKWAELPGASADDKQNAQKANDRLDVLQPDRRIPRNLDLKELVARIAADRDEKAAGGAEKDGGVSAGGEAEQQSEFPASCGHKSDVPSAHVPPDDAAEDRVLPGEKVPEDIHATLLKSRGFEKCRNKEVLTSDEMRACFRRLEALSDVSGGEKDIYLAESTDASDKTKYIWAESKESHPEGDYVLENAKKEFTMMASFTHVRILAVKAFGFVQEDSKEEKRAVFITPQMPEGALDEFLLKSRQKSDNGKGTREIQASQLRTFIWQIIDGVCAIHDRGILHKDIKAANILVDNNGDIKIIDFGAAECVESAGFKASVSGTHGRLAPEVFTRNYNCLADMVSLGLLMLDVIMGEEPYAAFTKLFDFHNDKQYATWVKLIDDLNRSGYLPPELDKLLYVTDFDGFCDVIRWCLEPPDKRCSAKELKDHPVVANAHFQQIVVRSYSFKSRNSKYEMMVNASLAFAPSDSEPLIIEFDLPEEIEIGSAEAEEIIELAIRKKLGTPDASTELELKRACFLAAKTGMVRFLKEPATEESRKWLHDRAVDLFKLQQEQFPVAKADGEAPEGWEIKAGCLVLTTDSAESIAKDQMGLTKAAIEGIKKAVEKIRSKQVNQQNKNPSAANPEANGGPPAPKGSKLDARVLPT